MHPLELLFGGLPERQADHGACQARLVDPIQRCGDPLGPLRVVSAGVMVVEAGRSAQEEHPTRLLRRPPTP